MRLPRVSPAAVAGLLLSMASLMILAGCGSGEPPRAVKTRVVGTAHAVRHATVATATHDGRR